MGRRPKPAAEKALAGNPGKRRVITDEQLAAEAAPEEPTGDAATLLEQGDVDRPPYVVGFGVEFWDEHAPQLRRLKLLKPMDVPAFAMVCIWYDVVRRMLAVIQDPEQGPTTVVTTRHGTMPRKAPAWQVLTDAARALREGMAEFGMTPTGRARAALGALNPPARTPEQGTLPLAGDKEEPRHGSGFVGSLHRPGHA